MDLRDVWWVDGQTEEILVVEQILEMREKEIALALPPEFLSWMTRWMVTASVLKNLVYRRRKDI